MVKAIANPRRKFRSVFKAFSCGISHSMADFQKNIPLTVRIISDFCREKMSEKVKVL